MAIMALIAGCSSAPQEAVQHDHDHDFVKVSSEQLALAGIETGKPELRRISSYITCSGMADVPPESRADISAPLGGIVRKAPHYEGAHVKKGAVLLALAHPNYIQLQQDFLDAESQLDFLQSDKNRQLQLKEGEAASSKRVQEVSSNYSTMKARYDGFYNQLLIAGINPDEVLDKGIQSLVYLRAPFSGIISAEMVSLGKQVGPEDVLYQMYDPTHMHLELQVYPRDLERLEIGQTLRYRLQGGVEWRSGHIVLLGGGVNPEMRTVRVHAHPDEVDGRLRPGAFLQVEIEVEHEEVLALPEKAFEEEEGVHYIFTVRDGGFQRTPIKVGRRSHGYVEILQSIDEEVVTKGAYYLVEVEEEHDH